jgi:hypothetical protein
MPRRAAKIVLAGSLVILCITGVAKAETAAEAYALGCGGCHATESRIVRRIKAVPPNQRRAWIENFMAKHPCERDSLRALIVQYLLERAK